MSTAEFYECCYENIVITVPWRTNLVLKCIVTFLKPCIGVIQLSLEF